MYLTTIDQFYNLETSDAGMRLVVTGSRHWPTELRYAIEAVLYGAAFVSEQRLIVTEGDAKGVDRIAGTLARRMCTTAAWLHQSVPAQWVNGWRTLRINPGHLRNQKMIDMGQDVCVGWPHPDPEVFSRGTWDCVRRAHDAGIPTFVVRWRDGWRLSRLP